MKEHKTLLNQGFFKVFNILSHEEIIQLKKECSQILNDGNKIDYKDYKNNLIDDLIENYDNSKTQDTFFKTKTRPFVGISKFVDTALEKILFESGISEILKKYLIEPKLSHCMIRVADNSSNYLGLHTDSDSTLSMTIFLDDVSNHDATTTFIPKSHLYPVLLKNKIEKINPKFFKIFTKNSIGKAGDVVLFFNRTIHGVKTSSQNFKSNNMVLLLSFHCDYDKHHQNLLIKNKIRYNNEENSINRFIINYFELDEKQRKVRIENKSIDSLPLIQMINKQRLPFLDYLLFYILYIMGFILSNAVFLYRKLIKRST